MHSKDPIRYYSERDSVFGPPRDSDYEIINGVVYQKPRDTRMWMSVEWAKEHGIPVPEDWRTRDG